jgi:hypothetical protein
VKIRLIVSSAVLVCMSVTCMFEQATDGNLVGTITDASGGSIPDAQITINNLATNIQTSTMSGANGEYRFSNVPVGVYDLSVMAKALGR